jgi:hypothetical protein
MISFSDSYDIAELWVVEGDVIVPTTSDALGHLVGSYEPSLRTVENGVTVRATTDGAVPFDELRVPTTVYEDLVTEGPPLEEFLVSDGSALDYLEV